MKKYNENKFNKTQQKLKIQKNEKMKNEKEELNATNMLINIKINTGKQYKEIAFKA